MLHSSLWALVATATALVAANDATTPPSPSPAAGTPIAAVSGPHYDKSGALEPPTDYRKWQFLTSGFGMTYGPAAASRVPQHDNVYVRPEAYDRFRATGRWPEQTMFVLEVRTGDSEGSINHGGQFQTELTGIEVEIKDSRRFAGGWGFYEFAVDDDGPTRAAKLLPATAACYSCHAKNAAVENTFTQFYPTLFRVAQAKGTVRADFIGMPPTLRELARLIETQGWPAGERRIGEVERKWPQASVLQEPALNQLGYGLLQAGKTDQSIAVLELVAQRYPSSANAMDSLSEAYETAGKVEASRRASREARSRLASDKALAPAQRAAIEQGLAAREARLAKSAATPPAR